MRNVYPILIILLFLFGYKIKAQNTFVSVSHHQFLRNGKPYYFIGANYWYGGLLGLQTNRERGILRLQHELDFLQKKGITNLRMMIGSQVMGQIHGVNRDESALQ